MHFTRTDHQWCVSVPQEKYNKGAEVTITKRNGTTCRVRIGDWLEEDGTNFLCDFTSLDSKQSSPRDVVCNLHDRGIISDFIKAQHGGWILVVNDGCWLGFAIHDNYVDPHPDEDYEVYATYAAYHGAADDEKWDENEITSHGFRVESLEQATERMIQEIQALI